jgi:RNA polymerase sigma-70 factor (ECF subfamily)
MNAELDARREFEAFAGRLRPKLHRFCARMTGSAVDGEDVVQEALLKAFAALPELGTLANPEAWCFRIAHNAALDFLRRRARRQGAFDSHDPDSFAATTNLTEDRETVAIALATFMRLPLRQRGAVILRDVLGYSLGEVAGVIGGGEAGAKSALQRGRERLRQLAQSGEEPPAPALARGERARLNAYVDCFNARDFDAIRDMLAEDVRLDLVTRLQATGRENVGEYFHHYGLVHHWRFAAGLADGRPAMLVFDLSHPSDQPAFFVLVAWREQRVVFIRDFLSARYALEGVQLFAFA